MNSTLKSYQTFVYNITSNPSKDLNELVDRLKELNEVTNIPLLLTGAVGLASEAGELTEIVKKAIFQGKPLTEENQFHLKRELGDIMFYWMNVCSALNLDPQSVIDENIAKLSARYPNGFTVQQSEVRKEGDL